MTMWHPSEDDLTHFNAQALEAAYQGRARPKCSRDDFADGWMACLVYLRARSAFRSGRYQTEEGRNDEA